MSDINDGSAHLVEYRCGFDHLPSARPLLARVVRDADGSVRLHRDRLPESRDHQRAIDARSRALPPLDHDAGPQSRIVGSMVTPEQDWLLLTSAGEIASDVGPERIMSVGCRVHRELVIRLQEALVDAHRATTDGRIVRLLSHEHIPPWEHNAR